LCRVEGDLLAPQDRRPAAGRGTRGQRPQRPRRQDLLDVLTEAVRSIEMAVKHERVRPVVRAKVQAVTLLLREERARIQAAALPEAKRNAELRRIDGLATALARSVARDGTLLALLSDSAPMLDGTSQQTRELRRAAGLDAPVEEPKPETTDPTDEPIKPRQVVPRSVISRQLTNPFLAPDYSAAPV
jgi:hypothetical protein